MGIFEMMQAGEDFIDGIIRGEISEDDALTALCEMVERGEIVSTGNLRGAVIA